MNIHNHSVVTLSGQVTNFNHVLLTGSPGVGKTTLVQKVLNSIQVSNADSISVSGFFTKELRDPVTRKRTGFDIVSWSHCNSQEITAPLARTRCFGSSNNGPSVGNYIVDIQSFESLALPALVLQQATTHRLCIIDEIGKMELFSEKFAEVVKQIFSEGHCTVLATVPLLRGRGLPLVEELKRRNDVMLIEVTQENRDGLVSEVERKIRSCLRLS